MSIETSSGEMSLGLELYRPQLIRPDFRERHIRTFDPKNRPYADVKPGEVIDIKPDYIDRQIRRVDGVGRDPLGYKKNSLCNSSNCCISRCTSRP